MGECCGVGGVGGTLPYVISSMTFNYRRFARQGGNKWSCATPRSHKPPMLQESKSKGKKKGRNRLSLAPVPSLTARDPTPYALRRSPFDET
jgi:hypothetical protein